MKTLFTEKTTLTGIFVMIVCVGLSIAVFMGKLTGTEFSVAMTGVIAVGTFLIGVWAQEKKAATPPPPPVQKVIEAEKEVVYEGD